MKLDRRFFLRGSCQGALAVMGLPFLDCFLNSKGQAQTGGRPLPTRFNTFFWGCGLTASLWIPKKAGTDWDMTLQLKPLEAYRKKLNLFSGLRVPLDSKPNGQHWSGLAAANTAIAPFRQGEFESKTIDQQVAEVIGKGVRFRSVAASSSGDPRQSYSSRGGRSSSVNDFPEAYQAFQNSGFRLRALLRSMALSGSFYDAPPPAKPSTDTSKEVALK